VHPCGEQLAKEANVEHKHTFILNL
jgi:hypothetical protein